MRSFILASHGSFAQGIYESIEIIVGKQEHVQILTAFVDGKDDIKALVKEVLDRVPVDHDVIVCTDLLGGSVNNEFMKYLSKREQMYLLTGMNLPLLMQLFLSTQEDSEAMIQAILNSEDSNVRYCNELFRASNEESDEF